MDYQGGDDKPLNAVYMGNHWNKSPNYFINPGNPVEGGVFTKQAPIFGDSASASLFTRPASTISKITLQDEVWFLMNNL